MLFIDEIHRLHRTVEEVLYPAMEDFALDIIIGKGRARAPCGSICRRSRSSARRRAPGLLSAPLRDRFGVVSRLEYYTVDELAIIVARAAEILGVGVIGEAARRDRHALARARRGSPTGC